MTPDQFLLFADPLPEPMLLLCGDGLILAGNRATEDRLGIDPQGLWGKNLADVVTEPTEEVAHYLRFCSRSRKMVLGAMTLRGGGDGGIACRTEGTLLRPRAEGSEAVLLLRLTPKESAVGQFVALNQRIEDLGREVRRRKQAEEAVRQEGERLRVTLQSIGDAVIVADLEGRVKSMNPVAESLTGWGDAEATGHPLERVFNILNEKTRTTVENPAQRALRENVRVGLANHTVLVAKGGMERPIDDCAAPIHDGQGQAIGAVLVFRDITERRRLERQRAEQLHAARLLASIVESSEDAIISKNLDGIIQTWNAAAERLFGYTSEQAVGRSIMLIIPADRAEEEERIIARLRAGERVEHFDTVRVRSDGQPVHVSLTISPVRDEAGRVVGASKIARDISERKRMEEALLEEDRRKTEFLAVLAHELRNPLAPLRNGLQVLRMAGNDREAVEQSTTMMVRQLQHLVRLVDDLLDVSRISRGKIQLRKERLALAAVIGSALETCEPVVRQQDDELTVTLPDEPVYVDADKTRLAQAVCNLVSNAVKYSERGSRIWLTVRRDRDQAILSVKDAGIGIPAAMLPKVFDLFTQVDRTLERSQGGLGVGLTIVKRLVEMHGGSVEAKSEGYGLGSEFIIRLPAVRSVVHQQTPECGDGQARQSARHRVLVADDNVDAGDSLAMMLRLMGNEARTARDGLEALDVAESFRPDLILLDIGMPRLNGYDACRRIREQPWGKNVVLVALTGWGQEEDKRRSQEAGFNEHLVKPVEPAALEKLLAGLSDARRN